MKMHRDVLRRYRYCRKPPFFPGSKVNVSTPVGTCRGEQWDCDSRANMFPGPTRGKFQQAWSRRTVHPVRENTSDLPYRGALILKQHSAVSHNCAIEAEKQRRGLPICTLAIARNTLINRQ
jgi:hypothetical protein